MTDFGSLQVAKSLQESWVGSDGKPLVNAEESIPPQRALHAVLELDQKIDALYAYMQLEFQKLYNLLPPKKAKK